MRILILLLLITGCATRSSSKFYTSLGGSLVCGTLGIFLGKELSPDIESIRLNKLIGLGVGVGICGIGGYYLGDSLYRSDPRNQELEVLKFKKIKKIEPIQESLNTDINGINLSDLAISKDQILDISLIKGVPKELRPKIEQQQLIKYKIPPQTVVLKDGRTLYYSGGTAIEHIYKKNDEGVKK